MFLISLLTDCLFRCLFGEKDMEVQVGKITWKSFLRITSLDSLCVDVRIKFS